MSNPVTSFADSSWKVAKVRTADNSHFEFRALGPLTTPSAGTIPLEETIQRSRDLLAQIDRWDHGGLNE